MIIWSSRFRIAVGVLSGAVGFHRTDDQFLSMTQLAWTPITSLPAPTEEYHVRTLSMCSPMCPICPETNGMELGSLWIREYKKGESGLIIESPTLPKMLPIDEDELQIEAAIRQRRWRRRAGTDQSGSAADEPILDNRPPSPEPLDSDLQNTVGGHRVLQRRRAAHQASERREQHLIAVESHQLLVFGPLLHRLFTDTQLIKEHLWEGGEPSFVTPLAERDPVLRVAIGQREDFRNKPGRPPNKVAKPELYLERLRYAQMAREIKATNESATWSEIASAIDWPLGSGAAEVKQLERAFRELEAADEQTLSDLKEHGTKKTEKT